MVPHSRGSRIPQRHRGVALILVLWISLALTLIASAMAAGLQRELRATGDLLDAAQLRQAARAGISRAAARMLNMESHEFEHFALLGAAGYWHRFQFGDHEVRYRVTSELGRLDLNQADRELILGLLVAIGVEGQQADSLTDNILDWRDPSPETRLRGTPPAAYPALGIPEGRRDGPFESVEELQLVAGITAEIYRKLLPFVTTHTGARRPAPQHAAVPVLAAHPGMVLESAREWARDREDIALAGGGTLPAFPGSVRGGARGVWAIEAVSDNGARSRSHIETVISTQPGEHLPISYLEWREPPIASQTTGIP